MEQVSPMIKYEASPAESFISMPGDYPSLFAPSTPPSTTINPLDVMTPQSISDEKQTPQLATIREESMDADDDDDDDDVDGAGKKPTKKRKSWGQVLPEPKTNLPPR